MFKTHVIICCIGVYIVIKKLRKSMHEGDGKCSEIYYKVVGFNVVGISKLVTFSLPFIL